MNKSGFALFVVPALACGLTVWLSQRIFDDAFIPLLGLIALAYAFSRGWADRSWMLARCQTDEQRRAFNWNLVRCYAAGSIWIIGGVYLSSALRMDPPWLACLSLVVAFRDARRRIQLSRVRVPADRVHVRGRQLESADELRIRQSRELATGGRTITWGGVKLPESAATSHFAVVGVTGSGKTLTIRLLMQEVLSAIGRGADARAIVYDAKRDMASILAGMRLGCPIHLLNPFDARGVAWDIARDVNDLGPAQEIAAILIPENKQENQPFFSDASRQLLTYLMVAYAKLCPNQWTLRDLIIGSDERFLRPLLARQPEVWDRVSRYFQAKELPSVLSTINSRLARFEPVASAWHHASHRVSLTSWAAEPSILVLGTDPMFEFALAAINQMLVKRLTQIVLSQAESSDRRTWIILDEFRSAGNQATGHSLCKLLSEGRSKGVAVVIGYQDMGGLKDAYGEHLPAELTGQCNQKALLRIEDPDTAQWGAKCLGEQDVKEYNRSSSQGGASGGETWNRTVDERRTTRPVVLPDEIRALPPTSPANGLSGYYTSPHFGAWKHVYRGEQIAQSLLPPNPQVPNYIPRDAAQTLSPWDASDLARLNLPFLQDAIPTPRNPTPASTHRQAASPVPLWRLGRVTPPPYRSTDDSSGEGK